MITAFMVGSATAVADDWQFNPRVEIGAQADDNYLLTPEDKVVAAGPFADVSLQMRWLTPQTTLSLTPEVHETYLPDDHTDDSTSEFVDLQFGHTGQTYHVGLAGNYSKQTVVQSDRLTTAIGDSGGLGSPTGGESSGYVSYRDTLNFGQLTPTFTYDFTPLRRIVFTGSYQNVDYSTHIPGAYVPFVDSGGSVGFAQDFTPRDSGMLTGSFAHFDPHGEANTSNTYGVVGEWDHHVSTIQQAYIRVGAAQTSFGSSPATGGTAPNSTTTWTAGAGTQWAFQVTQIFLDLTRTIDPNGTGYTVRRDQLRLLVTRDFSEKVSGSLGFRIYQDSATDNSPLFDEHKYALSTLGFKWRWARAWSLAGEYDYAWQKFQSQPGTAGSNAVTFSVIYQPIAQDVYHVNPAP